MDVLTSNNVLEVSLTPGMGNLILAGRVGSFNTFSDKFLLGVRFPYAVEDDSLPAYESGTGYLVSMNELVRETVLDSTNNGLHVNFSSNVKRVYSNVPAELINELNARKEDAHFVFEQVLPATVWTVSHGMDKRPSVVVVDSSGRVVIGQTEYLSSNSVRLTFGAAFAGVAYLN